MGYPLTPIDHGWFNGYRSKHGRYRGAPLKIIIRTSSEIRLFSLRKVRIDLLKNVPDFNKYAIRLRLLATCTLGTRYLKD